MVKDDIREKIKGLYKSLLRLRVLGGLVIAAFLVLAGRLFFLQVIKSGYYGKLAQSNCVNLIRDHAPRGYIYDRNYKKIVDNVPSYTVSIIPFHFMKNEDLQAAINEVARILEIEPEYIEKKLKTTREYILEPVLIKRDITLEQLSLITEKEIEISGLSVTQVPKRKYEFDSLGSHLLGYVGEITPRQLRLKKYKKYKAGDIIGQTGVENYYDTTLRGSDGVMYILTDARGRQKKIIDKIEPHFGENLVLTIDYRLQKFAENIMDKHGYSGVILAEVPKTGEMLCVVSKPDYNLNYFSGKINIKRWKKLTRNKQRPLTNRAVHGLYSPGSIFKIPVGIGALNEGVIGLKTAFLCEGVYWIKTWPYKCWKRSGHGWESFYGAIAQSCDIFFYKTGLKMKVELLSKYASMFGLGARTGIDLPGEKSGIVPTREWKRRVARSPWFPGNTVMMSIGQGYIIATPVQIMNIVSIIANSGYAMMPRVVKAITSEGRRIKKITEPKKLLEVDVKKENMRHMQKALRMVVSKSYGTGKKSAVKGFKVAGKTATVENPHGANHAMYAGYAPFEDPEIVVYVLIEHGGGGGDKAAPVAGEIFDYYFQYIRKSVKNAKN